MNPTPNEVRVCSTWIRVNDPSAGSPTETLLRLLLPLDGQICRTSTMRKEGDQLDASVRTPH